MSVDGARSGPRARPTLALASQLSDLANEVIKLAEASSRPDLRTRITDEAARWSDHRARVVCVGRSDRASMQMAAALTGRGEVLDVIDHPSIPVIIETGGVDRAAAHLVDGQIVEIGLDQLGELPGRSGPIGHLELSLVTARLDERLQLVVCPSWGAGNDPSGVGAGLLARRADLVLVATELTAPISAADRSILERIVAERTELVIVGLGIERLRGWQTVLADSCTALRPVTSARISSYGLSSALVERAFDPELDDGTSAAFLEVSGLGELQLGLAELLDRIRSVRMKNLAAIVIGALDELDRDLHDLLDATERRGADAIERLASLKEELSMAREDRANWLVLLGDQMNLVRDDTTADLHRTVSELGGRLERRAQEHRGDATDFHEEARTETETAVFELTARLADRLDGVVTTIVSRTELDELGVSLDPLDLGALVATDVGGYPQRSAGPPAPATKLRTAGSMVTMGTSLTMAASAGEDIFRLAAFGAAALLAGVTTVLSIGSGRRDRSRHQLMAELRAQLEPLRVSGPPQLRAHLVRIQRGIEGVLKEEIRRRSTLIERRLGELQQIERTETAERRRLAADARGRLDRIEAARTQVVEVIARLDDEGSPSERFI